MPLACPKGNAVQELLNVLKKSKSDEIQRMLMACRGYFITAALFSLAINLLYLASPL